MSPLLGFLRRRSVAAALPVLLLAACADHELPTAPSPADAPPLAMFAVTQAGSPNVVISQVYGGGGNSGAPYTHDFVELFNRGSAPVSLSGWSVQYASATGTGNFGQNNIAQLSGTLAPGQYYLVRLAGGANGVALPTPDATGSVNMSASAGKVVLASTSSGIACNGGSNPCSADQLAVMVDLVGFGGANFFEGSGAAPALNNTTAAFRENGGCKDTDDNAADFSTGAPAPRNTASPQEPCPVHPGVTATAPADGAEGVPLNAQIGVTFDRPVTVSGEWITLVCTTSGTHALTQSGGPSTFVLTPTSTFAAARAAPSRPRGRRGGRGESGERDGGGLRVELLDGRHRGVRAPVHGHLHHPGERVRHAAGRADGDHPGGGDRRLPGPGARAGRLLHPGPRGRRRPGDLGRPLRLQPRPREPALRPSATWCA
jgi:hypothetical protein